MTARIVPVVPITVVKFAREHGLPPTFFDGLPASVRPGPDLGRDASFADVIALFRRLETSPDLISAFADHYVRRVPMVSYFASFVVTTGGGYRLAFAVWRRLWPMLNLKPVRTPEGWILRTHVSDGEPDADAMFRVLTELLIRLPQLIGGDSTVTVCELGPRTAMWRIDVSPDQHDDQHDPDPEVLVGDVDRVPFPTKLRIRPEWGLTTAEARVVEQLVEGLSVNDIATTTSVSRETVRTHVKRAMAKAGVRRQVDLVLLLKQ